MSFAFEPERILSAAEAGGWTELPVRSAAALRVRHLPNHHHDPFDRLLVAQATLEELVLVTVDRSILGLPALRTLSW